MSADRAQSIYWPTSPPPETLVGETYIDLTARHRCLCQQCHSTLGVKIIAGFLMLSVIVEIWHLM
uniref:Uncharacterized protein n=1 Tax=Acrobeloides nanus TaxID=290746 RepID=A0A914DHX3_9BILA